MAACNVFGVHGMSTNDFRSMMKQEMRQMVQEQGLKKSNDNCIDASTTECKVRNRRRRRFSSLRSNRSIRGGSGLTNQTRRILSILSLAVVRYYHVMFQPEAANSNSIADKAITATSTYAPSSQIFTHLRTTPASFEKALAGLFKGKENDLTRIISCQFQN